MDRPITLPDFKIAGMDPLQQMALSYAPQMFGSFQPYMQGAQAQIGSGLGTLGAISTGIGASLGQLADPSESVKGFLIRFKNQVIQQAEKDIERDADLLSQKLLSGLQGQGQGIGSGQRSGRSAVLEAELARNTADQKARTLSGLRSGGFRDAMTNMLRSSQLLGGLGGALGQVGGMYNQFACELLEI